LAQHLFEQQSASTEQTALRGRQLPGMNSNRLGEPLPIPVRTLTVARLVSVAATSPGDSQGFSCSTRAAAPATCGAAMEVPLNMAVSVSLVCEAEVIASPGAKISRQLPKLEKNQRESEDVVAPTV
jgi:hypothetical protein